MKISNILPKKRLLAVSLFLWFFSTVVFAEVVIAPVANKLQAQAEYYKGNNGVAVLINHGFLTTNKFGTIQSMINVLKEQDYSILAPNLTLGINLREQSLKCNSLHTHTLEQDIEEISQWVNWLSQKGYQKIVLLGHSSGSQELLISQITHPNPEVKLAIFTSLFFLNGKEIGTDSDQLTLAQNLLDNQQNTPRKFSFLFCHHNYFATPESFLSYHKLTRSQNLAYLNALKIPSYTIMGGKDKRYQNVGLSWLDELKATQTNLIVIKGANHFFTSEHEFDLQDHIIEILNNHFKSE